MTPGESGFVHRYIARSAEGPEETLLLLHGTGGDENDLIPLGRELLPGAGVLSLRGKVLENGMPRFFRRLAEGVFDQQDLARQTADLAQFISGAARKYGFDADKVIAVGYSNGANIASSLMLTHPEVLSAAVLLRPMVPFFPGTTPDLKGVRVLIGAGRRDPIANSSQIAQLDQILNNAGARVSVHWHEGGHELGRDDIAAGKTWLAQVRRTPQLAGRASD